MSMNRDRQYIIDWLDRASQNSLVVSVVCFATGLIWANVTLKFVPSHSNARFSRDPFPSTTFSMEREYIGEDDDAHPAFFCWGDPDKGTFHMFLPEHVVGIGEKVNMVLVKDMDIEEV